MAIPFDLSVIEARLDSMKSKKERLAFLRKFIFELEKQRAEFDFSDSRNLERLKNITDADYKKYHAIFDAGGLVSLNPGNDRWNAKIFENIALLRERISLENKSDQIRSMISLFNAKLGYEAEKQQPSKLKPSKPEPSTFIELFTSQHWANCFRYVLLKLEPIMIDEKDNWIGPHGYKGIIPILIKEMERKGGMNPYTNITRATILNQNFKGLNLTKDASEWRKHYIRLEENNVVLDIANLISHFPKAENSGK
jgi:hypothetical protein